MTVIWALSILTACAASLAATRGLRRQYCQAGNPESSPYNAPDLAMIRRRMPASLRKMGRLQNFAPCGAGTHDAGQYGRCQTIGISTGILPMGSPRSALMPTVVACLVAAAVLAASAEQIVTRVFITHGRNTKILDQVKRLVSYGKQSA